MTEDESAEDLFPGPALPEPEWASTGTATFRLGVLGTGAETPREVRHAHGYARFVQWVRSLGEDPAGLAMDLPALLEVLGRLPELLDDPEVARAAATFLGNALVVAHPAATWRLMPGRGVGTGARQVDVDLTLTRLARDPASREPFLAMLPEWAEEDEQEALDARYRGIAMDSAGTPAFVVPAVRFTRPAVAQQELRDDDVILYGEPWPGSPPDDAYSRVSHPERFAPLIAVTDALIAYLTRWYRVEAEESVDEQGDRVVDLVPEEGAPVRLRFTAFPGVDLHAGARLRVVAPTCGCDACDETAESAIEQVEGALLAVAGGGLTEFSSRGPRGSHVVGLRMLDGSASGSTGAADEWAPATEDDLEGLQDGRWPAWPLRTPHA